ncbi:VOC family protein [Flammeovirgaceae bacterium SG7u.111]|nr:VOC family protein [Flammeovirgaceae bacterium SG7u.132]WPO34754.1 VOC family protein [Flammeovirgaceae bacterium SG7u.111]
MNFKKLKLFTTNPNQQKEFYQQILGLPTFGGEKGISFSVNIGSTELEFIYGQNATPYHFAINIPSSDTEKALAWLKERVEILKYGDAEIADFKSWNAASIYFYDPDKNIVELIARKNLKTPSHSIFDQNSFLNISEIGIPVTDIKFLYDTLQSIHPIEIYDGNFEIFCAMGDENGLFIAIDIKKKTWFPIGDTPYASEFDIELETNGKPYQLTFKNGEIWKV